MCVCVVQTREGGAVGLSSGRGCAGTNDDLTAVYVHALGAPLAMSALSLHQATPWAPLLLPSARFKRVSGRDVLCCHHSARVCDCGGLGVHLESTTPNRNPVFVGEWRRPL